MLHKTNIWFEAIEFQFIQAMFRIFFFQKKDSFLRMDYLNEFQNKTKQKYT